MRVGDLQNRWSLAFPHHPAPGPLGITFQLMTVSLRQPIMHPSLACVHPETQSLQDHFALFPSLLAHRADSLLCLSHPQHLCQSSLKVQTSASMLSGTFDIIIHHSLCMEIYHYTALFIYLPFGGTISDTKVCFRDVFSEWKVLVSLKTIPLNNIF